MSHALVLDASVIVACVADEETAPALRSAMMAADWIGVGAPTLLEANMVLVSRRLGPSLVEWLETVRPDVLPFHAETLEVAVAAFDHYGKGRHPAGLNFGDCMAYATARLARTPLLYVGSDFGQTDLDCVGL